MSGYEEIMEGWLNQQSELARGIPPERLVDGDDRLDKGVIDGLGLVHSCRRHIDAILVPDRQNLHLN